MPPTMRHSNSDCVMRGTYGLTMSGASVCPMNTLAAADSVSAPLVPMKNIHGAGEAANDDLQDAEVIEDA